MKPNLHSIKISLLTHILMVFLFITSNIISSKGQVTQPTISGGAFITSCVDGITTLNVSIGGNATTVNWSGGNPLNFSNAGNTLSDFHIDYTADVTEAGDTIIIIATTDDWDGPGHDTAASDTFRIFVYANPTGTIAASASSICSGSPVNLTLSFFGIAPFNYQYSDNSNNFTGTCYASDTSITVSPLTTQTYTLNFVQDSNCNSGLNEFIEINVSTCGCANPVIVDAGPDIHVCTDGFVGLNGVISGGTTTGHWTGGLGIVGPNRNSPTATYTPHISEAGTIVTLYLVSDNPGNGCDADSDFINITVDEYSYVNAGPDIHVCENGIISLNGIITGIPIPAEWVGGLGTFTPSRNSLVADYTPDPSETGTTVSLLLIPDVGDNVCPIYADQIDIFVDQFPLMEAGTSQSICANGTITLNGSVIHGATSGHWSGGLGTFSPDRSAANATYTPDASENGSTVNLYFVSDPSTSVCLPDSDLVQITVTNVFVDAGPDIHVCEGGIVGLNGIILNGASSGHWSGGLGNFSPDRNTLVTDYAHVPSEIGTTITLYLSSDATATCPSVTDSIKIHVDRITTVYAGPDIHACINGSVDLNGIITGDATGALWNGGLGTFIPDRNTLNATYIPAPSESQTVVTLYLVGIYNPDFVCTRDTSYINITVDTIPTADAGSDQTICANQTALLNGSVIGGIASGTWTSSGDGTFGNSALISTNYNPGINDISNGSVKLFLNPDVAGVCPVVNDSLTITIHPIFNTDYSITECNSYLLPWGGSVTISGDYSHTYSSIYGCDSMVTAHVTINYSSTSSTTQTACNSYTWNSVPHTTSGSYTSTGFINAAGCDSTATVELTIKYSSSNTSNITICNGQSYMLPGGTSKNTSGTYITHILNSQGCDSAITTNLTVLTPISVNAVPGTIMCNGGNTSVVVQATGGSGIYTSGIGTLNSYAAGTYTFNVTDNNGCTGSTTITINQPAALSMTACTHTDAPCFGDKGSVGAGSVSNSNGGIIYSWKNTSNVEVGNMPAVSGLNPGMYTLTVTDKCSSITCSQTILEPTALNIFVTPGSISCYGGSTCVTVSATGGTPAYTGTGIFCGVNSGMRYFEISDQNNCIASKTINISQPAKITSTPGSSPETCNQINGTATVTPIGGTPGYTFNWQPGGQTSQTATALSTGNYIVTITDLNNCTGTVSVNVGSGGSVPPTPDPISGPAGACKGQSGVVYCVAPVAGATSYIWTLPSGITGTSTGPCITVSFSTKYSGNFICVKAVNSCGAGANSCLNIPVLPVKPATPGPISGPSSFCSNALPATGTYCITPVTYATNYIWSIYGSSSSPLTIVSGQGTTCIVVNIPAGYTGSQKVKVLASNCKGNSNDVSYNVNIQNAPAKPGSITGSNNVCKSQTLAYSISSVSGAISYTWSITGGATIASGQGTRNITVNYTTASSYSATLSVVAVNSCGSSAAKTLAVTVNLTCKISNSTSGNQEVIEATEFMKAFPNPSHGSTTIEFSSETNETYSLKIVDIIGKIIIDENIHGIKGRNTKEIELGNTSKGMYFIILKSQQTKDQILRLIIE